MNGTNLELIERFYAAFADRDGAGMAACYSADATFDDPVFPGLRGAAVGGMWRYLTGRSSDLVVELLEHDADDVRGRAHWVARYTFTQTGRKVVNDVRADLRFAGGLIAAHRDDFSFYRWAAQALGPSGALLGWTPVLRAGVRRQARAGLEKFMASSDPRRDRGAS